MITYYCLLFLLCFLASSQKPFLKTSLKEALSIQSYQMSNETNSGIAIALSNNFYQGLAPQILQDLSTLIEKVHISDIKIEKSILFIDFILNITSLNLSEVNFDSTQLKIAFQSDNTTLINIVASEFKIDFHYALEYGLIDISDSGFIEVIGLNPEIVLNITKTSNGTSIELASLYIDYDSLKLNFGDCISPKIIAFITQEVIDLIWPLIRSSIISSLVPLIQENIDKISDALSNSIHIPNSDVDFDISLINSPFVLGNYYVINLNGDFYKNDSIPEILVPPIPFQINLTENVSQIFLHQICINSLFKHVFDTHILNYSIDGNITDGFQIKLDSRSLDGFFPELRHIPNQEVIFLLENQITYQPKISFIEGDDQADSHINLEANLTLSIYLGEFSETNYFLSANVSFSANFKILIANEGFVLRVNNIYLRDIQTLDIDKNRINKEGILRDGNILLNLGVSDLNKVLYKNILLFPKFMSLEVQCLRLKVYDTYIAADIEIVSGNKNN